MCQLMERLGGLLKASARRTQQGLNGEHLFICLSGKGYLSESSEPSPSPMILEDICRKTPWENQYVSIYHYNKRERAEDKGERDTIKERQREREREERESKKNH